ncbi:WXG100 family type VII secretion target [Streptomyces orinoci]|uniref:WXG100 family type VII secretion target n=1 Tax=Streptomyces orinoci TaxID=67339 RepID=A0ABV3JZ56_STRON|nr:WXG100 family type VII secretion target [Streptomyces orinoci]
MGDDRLRASHKELTDLASDLRSMGRYLRQKANHLNELVESVDSGWQSAAASSYKQLQADVNKDIDRIREMLYIIEQGVEMSRDGFTGQDLEIMRSFRRLQSSADGERQLLARADAEANADADTAQSTAPASKLDMY